MIIINEHCHISFQQEKAIWLFRCKAGATGHFQSDSSTAQVHCQYYEATSISTKL